jgi:2,4-dienoyl-CoA reductase-like NADH-dependent reductase (Old Yellow Enzyme family)
MIKMELKTLFSPQKIGNVKIPNRIVRSATFEHRAEKYGYVGPKILEMYNELARGGTGLIITGFTAVDPSGTGSPYQLRLDNDSYIAGHKKLVDVVHEQSDIKVAIQIVHQGRQCEHPKYPPIAPSPIPDKTTGLMPRELSTEEVYDFIKKFKDTAIRAYECEYDMVQLHACHGYLLSNFISPYTNKRKDEFGGSDENMARILVEIFNQIRDEVGKKFPITIKLQIEDFVPEGLTIETSLKIAKILADTGYDAIEPSGGIYESQLTHKNPPPSKMIKSTEDENYFLSNAKRIKPLLKNTKLILVGGIKNPLSAEKILQDNSADFISLCRPLIYEPNLPNRWKNGDIAPAKCISCNACLMIMRKGPIYCQTKRNLEKKGSNQKH